MAYTQEQLAEIKKKYGVISGASQFDVSTWLQSMKAPPDPIRDALKNVQIGGLGPSASTSGIPTGTFGPTLEQRMQPRPEGEGFGEFLKGIAKAIPGIPLDILQGAQEQQTQLMKETTPPGQEKMLPPSLEGPTGAEQIREVLPEGITQPLTPGQEAGYNTAMILSLLFPSIKKRGFTPIIESETIGGMRRPPTRLPEIGEPNLPVVSEGALPSIGERIAKKRTERLVNKRVETLQKIEQGKAGLRNYIGKQKDRGFSPTEDIAKTDLLQGSVDNTGTVRTKQEGGAIDQYTAFIKPQEKVISKILEQEGATISLSEVEARLIKAVQESGMKGASRTSALSQVQREIEGYYSELNLQGKLPSDKVQIPISLIHDAKIDKYANINYMSESGRTDKLIAKQLKQLVEENTKSADVKALNEELARHYTNIGYLEKLDGAKVEGGRLGKHFARILGGMAGSSFGPLGTVVGAELAGGVKGKIMSSTFKKPIGGKLESSEAMKKALQSSKSEGARKMSQSPTIKATTTTSIEPNLTPKLPESKGVAGGTGNVIKQKIERRKTERRMRNKPLSPKGKGAIPETKTIEFSNLPVQEAVNKISPADIEAKIQAKKYKSAEEFVSSGKKLYRGGTSKDKLFVGARGKASGQNTPALYFTDKPAVADLYKQMEVAKGKQGASVLEESFNPKLFKKVEYKDATPYLTGQKKLEDGYLGVYHPETNLINGKEVTSNTYIQLKTKSQLTDIWNKAHKK